MSTSKSRRKKPLQRELLPDLEHAKTALLNSLTSASGRRTYDHAIREFVASRVVGGGIPSRHMRYPPLLVQ
jgi:hypothetical protein